MKAGKVKGLDASRSLADNAVRVVRKRSKELLALGEAAIASGDLATLHDVRIAAKRLRYALDVTAFCFGPEAVVVRDRARELQDVLGELHDCDVLLPRVQREIDRLRAEDAAGVREASAGVADLRWRDLRAAPNRRAYAGLEQFALYLAARREVLRARFIESWTDFDLAGFRERLRDGG